jgi:hypothetical protein
MASDAHRQILSTSYGPSISVGGSRLSRAEEIALNLLIKRAAGEESGMALYKLGWALEDNNSSWDATKREFVYDTLKKTPVCFHASQASYHLLSWQPPSEGLLAYQDQFVGEDMRNGTYNCIMHFVDPQTDEPFNPTGVLMERIIPMLKEMHEAAVAGRKGFEATQRALRTKKIERIQEREKKKARDYDAFATSLLENESPAFEGNPTSFPGAKHRHFSDRSHETEVPRVVITDGEESIAPAEEVEVPTEFALSVKTRKQKE